MKKLCALAEKPGYRCSEHVFDYQVSEKWLRTLERDPSAKLIVIAV